MRCLLPTQSSVLRAAVADYGVEDESDGAYPGRFGEGVFDPLAVDEPGWSGPRPGRRSWRLPAPSPCVLPGEKSLMGRCGPQALRYFQLCRWIQPGRQQGRCELFTAFSFTGDFRIFTCSPSSPCITDVDLSGSGLDAISYLRISTAGNSGQGFPAGYTLDAVEALNFRSFSVSEPGTLVLFGAAAGALAAVRRRKSNGQLELNNSQISIALCLIHVVFIYIGFE